MTEEYLAELLTHLQLPARRRRRIAAEVEDHLACAAAELHAGGLSAREAELEAIRQFGPARELAQTFLEQEAARGGLRAAQVAGLVGVLGGIALVAAPGRTLFGGAFPSGLLAIVFGQVAIVAGGLTFARAWRCAPDGGPRGVRLHLVLRGSYLVLVCMAMGAVFGLSRALSPGVAWGLGAWATFGALIVGAAATAVAVARGQRKAHAASPILSATEPQNALVDLRAAAVVTLQRCARHVPVLRPPLALAARLAQTLPETLARRLPRLAAWLDLGRHPWRFALAVSCAVGIVLAVAHGATEGGFTTHHAIRQLYGGGLIAAIEAVAALLGFTALGPYLGLRSGDS